MNSKCSLYTLFLFVMASAALLALLPWAGPVVAQEPTPTPALSVITTIADGGLAYKTVYEITIGDYIIAGLLFAVLVVLALVLISVVRLEASSR